MNDRQGPNFRLFRSESDRKISGVSGGLAEALAIDSTLVRLLWVLVVLVTSGVGLLAYLAMWAIVPPRSQLSAYPPGGTDPPAPGPQSPESGPESKAETQPTSGASPSAGRRPSGAPLVAGIVLIAVGLLFLADNWVPLRIWSYFGDLIALALRFWPLILIAAGAMLLYSSLRR